MPLVERLFWRGQIGIGNVMVPNPAIRNLIREDKVHQIYSMMQTGQAKYGMQTMNQSLAELYQRRQISYEEAMGRSSVPEELSNLIGRAGGGPATPAPAREQRINR